MPYSDASLRPWVLGQLRDKPVSTVVDVGAGGGSAKDFFEPWFPGSRWTAIEAWPAYVPRFLLAQRYAAVLTCDVRKTSLPPADLYIFGDVLEHMPAPDAIAVWERAREAARWLVISLPIVCYPQGAAEGNPHEAHLHHWSVQDVLDSFPGITAHQAGPVVGAFIAGGLR